MCFLDFLGGQHVVQRVVQRPQIRRDFFVKVARQKAQRLARLDGGAGQNDPRSFSSRRADSAMAMAR